MAAEVRWIPFDQRPFSSGARMIVELYDPIPSGTALFVASPAYFIPQKPPSVPYQSPPGS
ncbi:hypothetical protein ACXR0O_28425 [Verrucomicrobiota bacterium sgz303538]